MNPREHEQVAVGVSTVTIVINVALSVFKFAAGILARSGAMVSDAVHSASDVLATLIVILGVNLAGRAADADHPYGHERLECVAALVLGIILGATGLGIGWTGIRRSPLPSARAATFRTQKGTSLPTSSPMRSSSSPVKRQPSWRFSARRTAAASALPPPSPPPAGMRFVISTVRPPGSLPAAAQYALAARYARFFRPVGMVSSLVRTCQGSPVSRRMVTSSHRVMGCMMDEIS